MEDVEPALYKYYINILCLLESRPYISYGYVGNNLLTASNADVHETMT